MSGGSEQPGPPREAFSLLGHDVRLGILLALLEDWEAAHTEPRRYAELMRALDMEDSGKFNYHLGRLRGPYLRKVEGGYVPTAAATALYRAVLAHRPTADGTSGGRELDPGVDCPDCGEGLTASHEREFLSLWCPACASPAAEFTYPLPRNAVAGRSDAALLAAAHRRARAGIGLARTGQCPDCAGRTEVAVDPEVPDGEAPVTIGCDTCSWTVRTGLLLPLLSEARVAGALAAVGLPVESAYAWELPRPSVTVRATDPLELELVVTADGGVVTVRVDGELGVRSVATDAADGPAPG